MHVVNTQNAVCLFHIQLFYLYVNLLVYTQRYLIDKCIRATSCEM